MTFIAGNPLENLGISIFGSLWAFAVFIIIVLFVLLLIAGLDPMLCLMFTMPLVYAFGKGGWWPSWISFGIFAIFLTFAGYMFYQRFVREY